MSIHLRGRVWHLDVIVSGTRIRESLDTESYQEARDLAQQRVSEVREERCISGGRRLRAATFPLAASAYLRSRATAVSASTLATEGHRAKPLVDYFAEFVLRRIRIDHLEAYREHRLDEDIEASTINAEVSLFKRIVKRADLSFDLKELPVRESVGRALSVEDKAHLFAVASSKPIWHRAYLAARLAVSTGMRRKEIRGLLWTDVDPVKRTITVRGAKTDAGDRSIPYTEGGPVESVLIALETRRTRTLLGNAADPVFPWKSWRGAWETLTEAAGLPGIRFHDLRHQVVTELAEAGVPEAVIEDLVGHVSEKMRRHYTHIRVEAKRQAVAILGA